MYRDLGFIRVGGKHARRESDTGGERTAYAYLVYPHKPIVAYVPGSGQLLSEYCVEFPDLGGTGGRHRLPASDDVLAKWMALTSDEDRVIRRANMHLIGRQHDPRASGATSGASRSGSGAAGGSELEQRAGDGNGSQTPTLDQRDGDLETRSRVLLDGPEGRPRAQLKGVGYDDEALQRPMVGVANTWTETMPCNFHLRRLAERVKEGVRAAGATPMEFNTVAISDGIAMGTEGMKASLVSREVIADSIELVARGHMFDALVALCGCDKTIPGCVMAIARLNLPGLMLYGGSHRPRHLPGQGRDHPGGLRGRWRALHGRHELDEDSATSRTTSPGPAPVPAAACSRPTRCRPAFEVLGI